MGYTITEMELLKTDLGLYNPNENITILLGSFLETAKDAISKTGITLDENTVADQQLVEMYAAWLYRKRDNGSGMPPMLTFAIRRRLIAQKTELTT